MQIYCTNCNYTSGKTHLIEDLATLIAKEGGSLAEGRCPECGQECLVWK